MSIIQFPSHGENDPEISEVFVKGALADHAEVPLTIFVDGKHHVIGTATIDGDMINAALDSSEIAEEVMDVIMGRPEDARFSIGFRLPPYPFTERPPYVF